MHPRLMESKDLPAPPPTVGFFLDQWSTNKMPWNFSFLCFINTLLSTYFLLLLTLTIMRWLDLTPVYLFYLWASRRGLWDPTSLTWYWTHAPGSRCSASQPLAAAAAKSLQSCPTLCDPGSPPGSPVPGILQARTLEWVAISFSNAWKWKVKVKSLSCVRLLATPWTAAHQAPLSMGFSRQEC